MRSHRWILVFVLVAATGCQGQRSAADHAEPLTAERGAAVEQSVRGFMAKVAEDVTQGGPTAWSNEFDDGPNFFMASEGVLVFPSGAAAAQGIPTLTQIIKKIELRWGPDLRVDPLTTDLAVVGTTYQENRADPQGHELTEKGYFSGVVEQRNGKWRFRDAHWSVKTPATK
jgi:hypothetical protein